MREWKMRERKGEMWEDKKTKQYRGGNRGKRVERSRETEADAGDNNGMFEI